MKKRRFSDEKIVLILQELERGGKDIDEVCREYGICERTLSRWKNKYQGMDIPDVRKMRSLEQENGRLKRMMAERDLEIDAMKELLRKNL